MLSENKVTTSSQTFVLEFVTNFFSIFSRVHQINSAKERDSDHSIGKSQSKTSKAKHDLRVTYSTSLDCSLQFSERLRGQSHPVVPTPSISISGCNSEKVVGHHLFFNIIPSNFTPRTKRKVWCDRDIMPEGGREIEGRLIPVGFYYTNLGSLKLFMESNILKLVIHRL